MLGLSSGWIIDEVLIKKDQRQNINDQLKDIVKYFKYSVQTNFERPVEKDISIFRKEMHFYWRSHSREDGYYWNYMCYDFKNNIAAGRILCNKSTYKSKDGQTLFSNIELIRAKLSDPICILEKGIPNADPATISIFPSHFNKNTVKTLFGMVFHDDFDGKLRVSPSILSFNKLINNSDGRRLGDEDSTILQNLWDTSDFEKNIPKFEKYSKSPVKTI